MTSFSLSLFARHRSQSRITHSDCISQRNATGMINGLSRQNSRFYSLFKAKKRVRLIAEAADAKSASPAQIELANTTADPVRRCSNSRPFLEQRSRSLPFRFGKCVVMCSSSIESLIITMFVCIRSNRELASVRVCVLDTLCSPYCVVSTVGATRNFVASRARTSAPACRSL